MATVISVGIPLVKVTVRLTLPVPKPGSTGVAPAVGVPYNTMFWTAVLNAADGVVLGES